MQTTETNDPFATNTPEQVSSPEPENSPTPEPTKVIGTFPDPLPGFNIRKECIPIAETLLSPDILTGILILDSETPLGYVPPYMINLANDETIPFPVTDAGKVRLALDGAAVSPDRKLFAYVENFFDPSVNDGITDTALHHQYEDAPHELRVISAEGQLQSVPNWQSEWGWIVDWPDGEKLLLAPSLSKQDAGTLITLNPTAGQHEILQPTFPSIEASAMPWYPFANIPLGIHDPTISQVLYLNYEYGITLWDNVSEEILWAMPGTPNFRPKWSPDGKHVLFAKDNSNVFREPRFEFFLVSQVGAMTQLSNFANAYPNLDLTLGDFSWSPDGQKVAFWVRIETKYKHEEHLAILDVNSQEIIETCLPGLVGGVGALAPVWSPNGQLLAIESANYKGFGKEARQVFLIDLESQYAVKILEDVGPIGWLVSLEE